jgi:ComF family protein
MATAIGAIRGKWKLSRQPLARWRKVLVDLLFPPRCVSCDADLVDAEGPLLLCSHCHEHLAPPEWSGCPACGTRLGQGMIPSGACHACRGLPFHFDGVVPLGAYDGLLRETVLKMKRAREEPLSMVMGDYFIERRQAQLANLRPDVIVPIPMHWRRRWTRKTNSPDLLAGRLGRFLKVPVADRVVRCCRNTLPHKDLPRAERFQNIRGAYRLAAGHGLRGARVLLVDDVLTTGATCNEAAKLLKSQGGAAMVAAAVLARADEG